MSDKFALIVEDNEAIAMMYKIALEEGQFVAECVLDGKEALERLKELVPDVIILDMNLPHVSGHYILKQIRADARLADTHVIIATANAPMAAALESQLSDMDVLFVKPVSPIELRDLAVRLRMGY